MPSHIVRLTAMSALTLSLTAACLSGAALAEDAGVPQNDLLNATLWMETSVEYKATVSELFKLAKSQLDAALADKDWTAVSDKEPEGYADLPVAIITDLDETMLDNGNYEASLITRGTDYSSKEWTDYVNSETSKAVPGALDFLKYADSKGVKIFYVSNRKAIEKDGTVGNLKALGSRWAAMSIPFFCAATRRNGPPPRKAVSPMSRRTIVYCC